MLARAPENAGIESTFVSEADLRRFFDPIRELSDSEERALWVDAA